MENNKIPLLRSPNGFQLPGTEIYLDPLQPVSCAVISHAHGDHAIPGHDTVYCTYNTAKLLRARFRNFANKVITPEWNTEFVIENIPFRFSPAGHMLGSAQTIWKRNGKTILYTGDFKRQPDNSCEAFQVENCDILITETTFAQNGKTHPDPKESILKLKEYPPVNFVIGAYTLGKAQRLTQLLNQYVPEFRIMLHPKIAKYHKVYEEAGMDLGEWFPFQRQVFRKETGSIYIIPPSVLKTYLVSPDYLRGMVSGWEHLQIGYELDLPISDHADWNELLATIKDCNASEIFTVHGEGEELKNYLSSDKIKIQAL